MTDQYKINIQKLFRPALQSGRKVFSVIGSGGKTTLIKAAAAVFCNEMRVGAAASAKMYYPDASWPLPQLHVYADQILKNGKMAGISGRLLDRAVSENDLLLIEADGSAGRPLKGWAPYEPVIAAQTQVTVCVIPAHLLGSILREEDIHRPEYFRRLTGRAAGDVMELDAYVRLIAGEGGLLAKGRGERILVLTHCDDDAGAQRGRRIAQAVQDTGTAAAIVYGSLL